MRAFGPRALQAIKLHTSLLWRRDEARLVRHLREMFKSLAIDAVLDVGANRGRYIELLRVGVGYSGEIFAFEPIPECAKNIRVQMRYDQRITLFETALGAENATRTLHVTSHDAMSSVYPPLQAGLDRFGALNHVTRDIDVPVRTLDSLEGEIFAGAAQRTPFLKIDTQGSDLDVLAGAGNLLSRVAGLQIEIPFTPIYKDIPPASAYFSRIEACGFALTGIFPVHSLDDHRIVDVDAVFRRIEAA